MRKCFTLLFLLTLATLFAQEVELNIKSSFNAADPEINPGQIVADYLAALGPEAIAEATHISSAQLDVLRQGRYRVSYLEAASGISTTPVLEDYLVSISLDTIEDQSRYQFASYASIPRPFKEDLMQLGNTGSFVVYEELGAALLGLAQGQVARVYASGIQLLQFLQAEQGENIPEYRVQAQGAARPVVIECQDNAAKAVLDHVLRHPQLPSPIISRSPADVFWNVPDFVPSR